MRFYENVPEAYGSEPEYVYTDFDRQKPYIYTHDLFSRMQRVCLVDCKTVRIFAYSSTRVQSNKRSGTRACEARALRARKTLTSRFTDFFTDFEKKTDCFAVYLLSFKNTLFTRPC